MPSQKATGANAKSLGPPHWKPRQQGDGDASLAFQAPLRAAPSCEGLQELARAQTGAQPQPHAPSQGCNASPVLRPGCEAGHGYIIGTSARDPTGQH